MFPSSLTWLLVSPRRSASKLIHVAVHRPQFITGYWPEILVPCCVSLSVEELKNMASGFP